MSYTRLRPFANGFEFDCWKEANCESCRKQYNGKWLCVIEEAVDVASVDDGTVPKDIADRMGFDPAQPDRLAYPCKEREATS